MSLCADAILGDREDAVAGVFAAAHDEVGGNGVLVVGAAAQDDAAAGVGIALQQLGEVQLVHGVLSLFQ